MSELNIKDIWKRQKLSTPDLEVNDLEMMLQKKSQSVVDKLIQFTRFEHIGNIVVSILMISYFMFKGDYAFSGVLFIFLFAIVLYYRKLYNKLAAIQPTADVHVYLVDVHRELKDFVKKYQVSLSVLFAIAFALALYIRSKEIPIEDKMQEPMFIVKLICMYIISLALAFFVVHLVYGQKIKKIREMLDEMEK